MGCAVAMTKNKKRAAACVIAACIAAPAEGLREYWYYCPAGVVSVCYGDTKDVDKTKHYTPEECMAKLQGEMSKTVQLVTECLPESATVNQIAAMSDLGYNAGVGVICSPKMSTLARKAQAGDMIGACNQILRWDKAHVAGVAVALPGLTKRRQVDWKICLLPDAQPIPQEWMEALK